MVKSLIGVSLFSFCAATLGILATRKLFVRYRFVSPAGIPLNGGLGIVLGTCVFGMLGFYLHHALIREFLGIFLASLVMFLLGILDDRHEVSVAVKFAMQAIATSVLILSGVKVQIFMLSMPVNILLTFFWMIGMTNAFNHLDVADGLCASAALIASLALSAVSFLNLDGISPFLTLPLAAAAASFLIFNLPEARVYLGNSGSHFLGFYLGATALFLHYASYGQNFRLFIPLLILGLPIIDTAFLIIVRLAKRKVPFCKSNDHLALRLFLAGYDKKQALLRMSGVALCSAVCGVLLNQVSFSAGLALIILAAGINLGFLSSLWRVKVDGS